MNDIRGLELAFGHRVLYPVRHGSTVTLVEGMVTLLLPHKQQVQIQRLFEMRYGRRVAVQGKYVEVKVDRVVRLGSVS